MTNIVAILAGGSGQRAGEGLPKQFRRLANGQSMLQTCVSTFRACQQIDFIIVVMHPDWIDYAQSQLPPDLPIIAGGKERWESSWKAIQEVTQHEAQYASYQPVNIWLHDCARPFVTTRIIEDVCAALECHEAVTVAVPATDTIYSVDNGQCTMHDIRLVDIPDRSTMFRAQTPQAFRLSIIRQAYERAIQDPHLQATDDCGIVHTYLPNTPIYIVKGDEQNKKMTFQTDFEYE